MYIPNVPSDKNYASMQEKKNAIMSLSFKMVNLKILYTRFNNSYQAKY